MSKLKLSAQEGRALALTLIVLAVGSLLIPPFLAYIGTNLLASRVTEEGMKEQYASDAGVEYAIWKLANDPTWVETVGLSTIPVTIYPPTSINDIMVTVEVQGEVPVSWEGRFGGQTTFPDNLYDVHFFNENVGWVVGEHGRILKTYDGGWTWFVQNSGTTRRLNAVFALSLTEVWAAGAQTSPSDSETLLYTNNGGQDWYSVATPGPPKDLNSIFFIDAANGWAAGDNGKILFYNGTAWTEQLSPVSRKLNSIVFLDDNIGWAVGEGGTVLSTTNGGGSWVAEDEPTNKHLNAVWFVEHGSSGPEDDYGWAVGEKVGPNQSTILKSTDGGDSWELKEIDTGIDFFDVQVLDPYGKGWVVGWKGNIRKTENGGVSWTFEDSRTNLDLMAVFFLDKDHGWAVGEDGIILIYDGTVWKPQNAFTDEVLNAAWFVDNQHGWIVGDKGVIAATLDGKEWITKTNSTVGTTDLSGVSFTSPYTGTVGWTVGEGGKIFKSDNAGDSWTLQYTAGVQLNAVYAISSTLAVAVGNRQSSSQSTILETTDGGVNWDLRTIQDDPGKNLLGVFFINPDKGWVVGEAGTVRMTTDSGNTWSSPTTITVTKDLYDVTFLDTNTGWIVGQNATLLKTNDGGISWSDQPVVDDQGQLLLPGQNPPTFEAVSFPDPNNGWIVGKKTTQTQATLLRTADGGDTWRVLPAGTSQDMHDVFVFDPCHGWVVGESGTILYFFCPPGQLAGGCGVFDINSVANNTTITSRIWLCGDGTHIASWEIK